MFKLISSYSSPILPLSLVAVLLHLSLTQIDAANAPPKAKAGAIISFK